MGAIPVKADYPGRVKGWHWNRFPDGTTQAFGAALQEFQGGRIDKDKLLFGQLARCQRVADSCGAPSGHLAR
ncbi:hypothetical protein D7Z26_24090 [Cohnella endophytica]|uniref:Uncharacterized protein n=1 Tax=Cohnella endophytica TaxID=2419778 RepID=A0A494XF25_9BACL|nr:hypothetical protein D7Z26_24090 [Cohnella endophytica]